jgi:hypothetical protein
MMEILFYSLVLIPIERNFFFKLFFSLSVIGMVFVAYQCVGCSTSDQDCK